MEREKSDINKKLVITLGIIGFCVIAYFLVIGPYLNRGEGDPYFKFYEVPVNVTVNSSIIHLEDKDVMNIRGVELQQKNGKIYRIYVRNSQNPEITPYQFNQKYGSRPGDRSSRKYLEYKGVYYYAIEVIP